MSTWHQRQNPQAMALLWAPETFKWKVVEDKPDQMASCSTFDTREEATTYATNSKGVVVAPLKPRSRLYRTLGGWPLQKYFSIEIVGADDRKEVLFHSTIHKNMPKKLTFCFSTDFTDRQILNDHNVITAFYQSFGHDVFEGQRHG